MNNKVLNFPAFWENEVLLNALSLLFNLFIYKLVISWRDVTITAKRFIAEPIKLGHFWCVTWRHLHARQAIFRRKSRICEKQRNWRWDSCNRVHTSHNA